MEDTFLPPFRACVGATGNTEGATSVMCSYNAVNGAPSCANKWLLEEELRGKVRRQKVQAGAWHLAPGT